jgi:PAS domain S-box-containing protein
MKEPDYHIALLVKEFARRKKNNPRYSYRAFAKFLGISSSTLSRLLMSQQEFSITISHKIINKLLLDKDQKALFTASIASAKKRLTEDLFVNAFSSDEMDAEVTKQDPDLHNMPKWLLNSTTNFVTVVDEQNRIIHMNEFGANLFGCKSVELKGKLLSELDIPPEVQNHYRQAFLARYEHRAEVFYVFQKRRFWYETIFTPIFNKWGKVSSVASLAFDITEKKVVENRLRFMTMMGNIHLDQTHPFGAFKTLVDYSALNTYSTDGCIFFYIDEKQDQILSSEHRDPLKKTKIKILLAVNREALNSLLSIPQKKAVLINDMEKLESSLPNVNRRSLLHELQIGSLVYAPLLDGTHVVGALFFLSAENNIYVESDREFAQQVALRASHMLIYQRLLRQGF